MTDAFKNWANIQRRRYKDRDPHATRSLKGGHGAEDKQTRPRQALLRSTRICFSLTVHLLRRRFRDHWTPTEGHSPMLHLLQLEKNEPLRAYGPSPASTGIALIVIGCAE